MWGCKEGLLPVTANAITYFCGQYPEREYFDKDTMLPKPAFPNRPMAWLRIVDRSARYYHAFRVVAPVIWQGNSCPGTFYLTTNTAISVGMFR